MNTRLNRRVGLLSGALFSAIGLMASSSSLAGSVIAESSFDRGTQGWSLSIAAEWFAGGGNPGGHLSGAFAEETNGASFVTAPAAYLGSWSGLDEVGELRFDYRRFSNGGGQVLFFVPLTVVITGGTVNPGGTATWTGETITGPTPWETIVIPISESAWGVSAGTWDDILSNVTEVKIITELVSNTKAPEDKNGFDNIVLAGPDVSVLGDMNGDGVVDGADLGLLLGTWGDCERVCEGDLNDDGVVDGADLGLLLGNWT